ncbi:uncharacterized protein LOC110695857 [Chenopodium quinoa]|uniref:uncharacterized protein LOC110695857 n=1 Tax=Chenopodium quinoa TaxID=63459 RepID=UPI000B7788B4|nr:uncharacterized protein LOC110695857 [Chenopodium quinoa]
MEVVHLEDSTLLHNNALPTSALLNLKGLPIDPSCIFCNHASESMGHLFQLWFVELLTRFTDSKDWVQMDSFFGLCLEIWLTRNNVRFRSGVYSPQSILDLASSWKSRSREARELDYGIFSFPPGFSARPSIYFLCSSMQEDYDVVLLFDGAWDRADLTAGAGWCFRGLTSPGYIAGGARACTASSALHFELLACLWGLRHASQRGVTRLLLHTDCLAIPRLLLAQSP